MLYYRTSFASIDQSGENLFANGDAGQRHLNCSTKMQEHYFYHRTIERETPITVQPPLSNQSLQVES